MNSFGLMDLAIEYTTKVHATVSQFDVILATGFTSLGKSLILLTQIEALLLQDNVIQPQGRHCDVNSLALISQEKAQQYCLFASDYCKVLGSGFDTAASNNAQTPQNVDKIKEIKSQMQKLLVDFLLPDQQQGQSKSIHPWMVWFVVGCFGGRISNMANPESMISLDVLGPACTFSLGPAWNNTHFGVFTNLVDLIQLDTNDKPDQATVSDILVLLKMMAEKCCQIPERRQENSFMFMGDVAYITKDYKLATRYSLSIKLSVDVFLLGVISMKSW